MSDNGARSPQKTLRPSPSREIRDRKPAFTAEVVVHLDFDLAEALGNFILDRECPNPALIALAHRLVG